MDLIREVEKMVTVEESIPCDIKVVQNYGYMTIQINDFSVFNIHTDGTCSRIGGIPKSTGLSVNDNGQIRMNEEDE